MKIIRMTAPRQVRVEEQAEAALKPDEVLIDIRYVGLCGSDLSAYRGLSPLVTYPRIPGHEVAGIISAKGTAVPDSLELGARCTVSPYSNCGACPACRRGRTNTCQFNQTLGVQRDGAMKERLAMPYQKVYTSSSLSLEELALVEPLSVGYHASERGRVSEIDTVLVLGCGAIGLGAVAAAARKGATVIAADLDEGKLEQAKMLGARHTIRAGSEDVSEACRELTKGEGVSVAIEAVGSSATYRTALEAACFSGRVVCIGYAKEDVALTTKVIVMKELDVLGSRNALFEFPAVISMLEQRECSFTKIISEIVPFERAPEAFSMWDAAPGKYTKILLKTSKA